jgi:hypothetical protein
MHQLDQHGRRVNRAGEALKESEEFEREAPVIR